MAASRYRMCQADRDKYGGPEWVTFDLNALTEMRGTQLEEIEAVIFPFKIAQFWLPSQRISARGQRAALWIARKMAGCVDDWEKFDPHIMQVETKVVPAKPDADGGDADPPAPGSQPGSTADG